MGNNSILDNPVLALTVTWNPRGELSRFMRLLPIVEEVYDYLAISFPPDADRTITDQFTHGRFAQDGNILVSMNHRWSWGRYTALKVALETPADFIQYGDMDRMLRWIETQKSEWKDVALKIRKSDCLIIGRTESAYDTHPQALKQTEVISNRITSYFLGKDVDVSAGSKGFSRQAVEYILSQCEPGHALGTDSEWPIVLHRAGFKISYVKVNGLTWESADQYKDHSVDFQEQHEAAIKYDSDPENWLYRVNVAEEIVHLALKAATRSLE